jgi:hypothetical protein
MPYGFELLARRPRIPSYQRTEDRDQGSDEDVIFDLIPDP